MQNTLQGIRDTVRKQEMSRQETLNQAKERLSTC